MIHSLLGTSTDGIISSLLAQPFWKAATWFGMRRLGGILQNRYPSAYGTTITHFTLTDSHPSCIALTIDDGLSRGGPATTMVPEILDLLDEYQAKATFFVCTDYVVNGCEEQAIELLKRGHELGNHLQQDLSGHYAFLPKTDFRNALQQANGVLEQLEARAKEDALATNDGKTRWFRAPQGRLTPTMRQVLEEQKGRPMLHVLGDCYCDDWLSAQALDGTFNNNNNPQSEDQFLSTMDHVAKLMAKQAQPGSIAIFHMPEHGFRRGTLYALKLFLREMQNRGWKCLTLSDMAALVEKEDGEESPQNKSRGNIDNDRNLSEP